MKQTKNIGQEKIFKIKKFYESFAKKS